MPSAGRLRYDLDGIASVLSSAEYSVPIYQRSYAWKQTAVEDFWDDLRQALDAGDPDYFLGTLVLTTESTGRRVTVIDGQQRLATTSLLLAALRNVWLDRDETDHADDLEKRYLSVFDRRSKVHEPRLTLNEEDDPFYRELVIERASPTPTRESHERISWALAYLATHLKGDAASRGTAAEERLVAWSEFMDDQATVITVTVPTEADAFVIFETLNDRGAQLTTGDLLKNFLFMRAKNRLESVKTTWIQALNELDLSAENDRFVTFLRHHWSSMHGAVRERDMYRAIKEDITTPAKAVKYGKQLAEAADLYAALDSPSDSYWTSQHFTSSARANVETLNRLDLDQNRPLLLAVMAHFDPKEIRRTLQALVSWSVRGIVVGGIGGGRTEKAYCDAAVKAREAKVKTADELLTELSPIVPSDSGFEEEFARATQTKGAIARYFQLALERAQSGESEPELVPNANEDEVNLEHILPQRAKATEWPAFSSEQVVALSQRIGNHTLLKKTENAIFDDAAPAPRALPSTTNSTAPAKAPPRPARPSTAATHQPRAASTPLRPARLANRGPHHLDGANDRHAEPRSSQQPSPASSLRSPPGAPGRHEHPPRLRHLRLGWNLHVDRPKPVPAQDVVDPLARIPRQPRDLRHRHAISRRRHNRRLQLDSRDLPRPLRRRHPLSDISHRRQATSAMRLVSSDCATCPR